MNKQEIINRNNSNSHSHFFFHNQ